MSAPSVLIAGCGDIGSRLATRLLAHDWSVHGLRRTVSELPEGVLPIQGDLFATARPADWPAGQIDYVVYCATPSQRDEAGYRDAYVNGLRHVLGWLKEQGQRPKRLFFVSSSGVYGQQEGEWVDETSATEPVGYTGTVMLEAEQLALNSGLPATAVRLTGIYGPGRADLSNRVRQGHSVRIDPPVYANRIHADDAAGLLAHLLEADDRGVALESCYLGVDDDPAALADVVSWIREYLGVTEWSDDVSVQRVGSKRCSNARARALGWIPVYPDYRAGYTALLGTDKA
ncbi:SDR family oxidoreductase [Pseudomonas viridiflava]|uniref:SDR family oxidoreductase n=1 Tax=Pseudomonas viridiflava TaxID=33069 RepID=UPI000BBDEF8A|nr:SDR family oxidoreductase [Pseudomonas viridiflava]MBV1816289.1 SDR family oxidoreductase [Pseudomonas viridiflava]MEE4131531.1 SDR family oxidoreductase [Pseudomonas viridiflava]MEE4156137.1 SDR family oxidoreductase [Pseudomonas viridiflava]PCK90803.1 NAD(P)-dependent oxidoreductase [Pseudomonas viridiflava]QXG30505.1 SDR family oxidoreductase [Pseudomonas viridiflava]